MYEKPFETENQFDAEPASEYESVLEESYLFTTKDSLFLSLDDFSDMYAYYCSLFDFYPEEALYSSEESLTDYSPYETVFSGIESFSEAIPYQVY